jgi:hypothetical protein
MDVCGKKLNRNLHIEKENVERAMCQCANVPMCQCANCAKSTGMLIELVSKAKDIYDIITVPQSIQLGHWHIGTFPH